VAAPRRTIETHRKRIVQLERELAEVRASLREEKRELRRALGNPRGPRREGLNDDVRKYLKRHAGYHWPADIGRALKHEPHSIGVTLRRLHKMGEIVRVEPGRYGYKR
jgi:hypothetical protein